MIDYVNIEEMRKIHPGHIVKAFRKNAQYAQNTPDYWEISTHKSTLLTIKRLLPIIITNACLFICVWLSVPDAC